MNTKLIVAASAAALGLALAGQASADPTATLGGGYDYTTLSGASGHLNDWNVNGSVSAPVYQDLHLQGDASYQDYTGSSGGGSAHTTYVSGTAFWQFAKGRIGATAGYNELGESGAGSVHFENYGAFGVFYPSNQVTLGIKGGALTGSGLNASYEGGEIVGYATPNLAFSGTIDNASISSAHITTYGVKGEYLVSQSTPIAVNAGYTYTDLSGHFHLNTYLVGVKFYFGKGGTLVDHQRNGDETWGTKQSALTFIF
jgi:hypothetical protein